MLIFIFFDLGKKIFIKNYFFMSLNFFILSFRFLEFLILDVRVYFGVFN